MPPVRFFKLWGTLFGQFRQARRDRNARRKGLKVVAQPEDNEVLTRLLPFFARMDFIKKIPIIGKIPRRELGFWALFGHMGLAYAATKGIEIPDPQLAGIVNDTLLYFGAWAGIAGTAGRNAAPVSLFAAKKGKK